MKLDGIIARLEHSSGKYLGYLVHRTRVSK
jgi:hypothetical protein